MKRFLEWLAKRRPVKHITGPDDEKYLERYFLLHIPILDITVYLHHFIGSDPDRGLHSHPWGWAKSLILYGQYEELLAVDIFKNRFEVAPKVRKAWAINTIRNDTWHRVILQPGKEVWTLFIHGKRVAGWYFIKYDEVEAYIHEVTKIIPVAINRSFVDFKWWKNGGQVRKG